MQLQSIQIKNYKSIEDVTIEIKEIEGSFTYSLLGVNEAGKSSILQAIHLFSGNREFNYNRDANSESRKEKQSVEIAFKYLLTSQEEQDLKENILANEINSFPETIISAISIKDIVITQFFDCNSNITQSVGICSGFDYSTIGKNEDGRYISLSSGEKTNIDLKTELENSCRDKILSYVHKVIFWRSEEKYLLNESVNLRTFSENPNNTSIPLANCFSLVGKSPAFLIEISNDPLARGELQDSLNSKVTEHINKVWPDHSIDIKFTIDPEYISVGVSEKNSNSRMNTSQRSDGFKQFISFLLTASMEYQNSALIDTILLIDEPETHLHPTAQRDLLKELILITKGKSNNILFFATHSNFLIDKGNIERNFAVTKENSNTSIQPLVCENMTYAKANYKIFKIITTDYHTELYSKYEHYKYNENYTDDSSIRSIIQTFEKAKTHKWSGHKKHKPDHEEDLPFSTCVRHAIHHRDNKRSADFIKDEKIKESVLLLERLIEKIESHIAMEQANDNTISSQTDTLKPKKKGP